MKIFSTYLLILFLTANSVSADPAKKRNCVNAFFIVSKGSSLDYQIALSRRNAGTDDYPEFKNYNDAMNAAIQWLKDHGVRGEMKDWKVGKLSEKHEQTLPNSFEKRLPNGRLVKVRIENHPISAIDGEAKNHINVSVGKEDGPHFIFPGGQAEMDALLKQLSTGT